MKKKEQAVLLHNIRSVHNVGSIFRTADAAGVTRIYISGYTPTPLDRFGRLRKDLAKVALGAEKTIAWEYVEDPKQLITKLKKKKEEKYTIVALEQSPKSVDYKKIKVGGSLLLVLGNEVDGVDQSLLSLCDSVVEIPMKGEKESLNVSVAFGIAIFRLLGI